MKKIVGYAMAVCLCLSLASCYTYGPPHVHLPPGKAKKIYGDKSAKRHAPGQKKKKGKKHKKHKHSRSSSIHIYYWNK